MCGIVGGAFKQSQENFKWLKGASDVMSHRGPDDFGEWVSSDNKVCFAHRRLSILEISPLGHQPMYLKEYKVCITFNGEIYNYKELRFELEKYGHRFISNSDTEVLLVAYVFWGLDFISKLNGMFAFAIYDDKIKKITCGRDRCGEKPFYYKLDSNCIYFASELKALFTIPNLARKLNYNSLDQYLSMGYVPGQNCIIEGYNKLPSAHAMQYDIQNGDFQIWQYWQPPELTQNADTIPIHDLVNELESTLEDAVSRQLVADVKVGVLLSGGLDSSIITALSVRHSKNIRTFSVGFPGQGKYDETSHARLIANYFGTNHIELFAEDNSALLLPVLASQFDEPIVDSSMIPTYLISQQVKKHCTVALGGDGGDELFGGYEHYSRLLRTEKVINFLPSFIKSAIAYTSESILPVGFKGRNWLSLLKEDFENGVPQVATYFDKNARKCLMKDISFDSPSDYHWLKKVPRQSDFLQRVTRMDFANYLTEDILVKVDRSSMLNSLEIRAPMLDYRVINFAFSKVPSYLKATEKDKKILLKILASKILPKDFEIKRKQGFSIPLSVWLKNGPYRDLFWDTLTSKDCIFNNKFVIKLLDGQDRGYSNSERLFCLVIFELWRKKYNIAL